MTIVFLVYNRKGELRESLRQMLSEADYDRDALDVIVVDNASDDGSSEMVKEEFPDVQLIVHERNVGVSGWNVGFAAAKGDWVLALDDDCYLPPDGLRRAVAAAHEHQADLVSFRVVSTFDPNLVFTDNYRTGLFSFWGCATLFRREVIQELGGYDPELFIWANELELTMRFYDRGYRHLHLPEVAAQHMKAPSTAEWYTIDERAYRINARHWAYIAGKLLQPRDSIGGLVALLGHVFRDAARDDTAALMAIGDTFGGYARGLRLRQPVRPKVSHFYRRNFITFASPWWLMRSPARLLRDLPGEVVRGKLRKDRRPKGLGRREEYFRSRAELYPHRETGILQL